MIATKMTAKEMWQKPNKQFKGKYTQRREKKMKPTIYCLCDE